MTTFETDGYRDGCKGLPYSPPSHPQTSVFTAEYQRGYNAGMLYSGRTAQEYARAERKARLAGQRAAAAYHDGDSLG